MIWKNWGNKLRASSIAIILAIIVGPFVDFFERIPVIKTLLYPFFYFTFRIIGKPFLYFVNAGYNRTMMVIFLYITNVIIYAAIGFLIGYLIDRSIKPKTNKSPTRPIQRQMQRPNTNNRVVRQMQQKIKKDDKLVKQMQQKIKKDDKLVKQIRRKTN